MLWIFCEFLFVVVVVVLIVFESCDGIVFLGVEMLKIASCSKSFFS